MDSILKAGVSKPKVKYLLALSEKWVDASWRKGWDTLSNEELTNRLIEVKGIGEWTAHMFLIFSLGKPDVLPVGDFGIRRGLQRLRELTQMPLPKEIPDLVKEWQGSESVGAWYLWQALDRKIL